MTTIVAVRKNGIAALCADSLTTFGDTRLSSHFDADHDKIFRYNDSWIGICGSAAHDVVLKSLFARNRHFRLNSRLEIYESFRKLHPMLKEEAFLNPKEEDDDPYESSQITALIANPSGIFGIYSLREVFEYTHYWAIGSGRDFALGAMHAVYDQLDDAEAIARTGVQAGAQFDTSTSLPMSLYRVELDERA